MLKSARAGKNQLIKIVLDTNVLISGFLNPHNPPGQIFLHLTEPGFLKLVISDEIFEEYINVLRRKKFSLDKGKIDYALKLIQETAITVTTQQKLNITQDEADNKFFECALEGRAKYIITGDVKHIQKVKVYKGIKIVSPAEFLKHLLRQITFK